MITPSPSSNFPNGELLLHTLDDLLCRQLTLRVTEDSGIPLFPYRPSYQQNEGVEPPRVRSSNPPPRLDHQSSKVE